jgi:hypothetical protein
MGKDDNKPSREFWIGCALTVTLAFLTSWMGVKTEVAVVRSEIDEYKAGVRDMAAKIDAIYDRVVAQEKATAVLDVKKADR